MGRVLTRRDLSSSLWGRKVDVRPCVIPRHRITSMAPFPSRPALALGPRNVYCREGFPFGIFGLAFATRSHRRRLTF